MTTKEYRECVALLRETEDLLSHREAIIGTRNQMGYYEYGLSEHQPVDTPELWALNDDRCRVEMAWGIYMREEGVRECYGVAHPSRYNDSGRGCVFYLPACTPYIEVAGDGKTTRSIWIALANEIFPQGEFPAETDEMMGSNWADMKYGVDCVLVDGEWKLLHLHTFSIGMANWKGSWADQPAYGRPNTYEKLDRTLLNNGERMGLPDEAPSCWWGFEEGCVYSDEQPYLPRPYYNFENDVGWGY